MRGPAAAIGWEFARRFRWGFGAVAAYLLLLAGSKIWILRTGRIMWGLDEHFFALLVMILMTIMIIYFLAVFTFGVSGDIAARQSIYPTRLFTLPVSTRALTAWPMIYGVGAIVLLWIGTRALGYWSPNLEITVPVIWPAFLAAAVLAWTQALTWMPYGLAGVRVVVAMLCLIALDTIVLLAIEFRWREPGLIAFLAPQVPLAYLVARSAVARARRGDTPDWRQSLALAWRSDPARQWSFRSPAHAQDWFEWRRHGRSLPALVAIVLPFELLLLWVAGTSRALVITIVLGALFAPVVLAAFAAAMVRTASANVDDSSGISSFLATRPVTTAGLIAAKLRTTVRSALAAWLVVAIALPAALAWSGTLVILQDAARDTAVQIGMARVVAFGALLVLLFMLATWRQLVQSLYVGLSGRAWVVRSSVFVAMVAVSIAVPLIIWVVETPRAIRALWDSLPAIAASLAVLKVSLGAWVAYRLWRARVVTDRALLWGAGLWLAAVMTLYGALAWFFVTPLVPRHVLLLLAVVAIPLARLSASPLALAWNRHR